MGGGGKYKLKEVTYTMGPDSLEVMSGLWKGAWSKTQKRIHENWVGALTLVVPVLGSYWYAQDYREKQKMHHRH